MKQCRGQIIAGLINTGVKKSGVILYELKQWGEKSRYGSDRLFKNDIIRLYAITEFACFSDKTFSDVSLWYCRTVHSNRVWFELFLFEAAALVEVAPFIAK